MHSSELDKNPTTTCSDVHEKQNSPLSFSEKKDQSNLNLVIQGKKIISLISAFDDTTGHACSVPNTLSTVQFLSINH